jgi:hypothetical protein
MMHSKVTGTHCEIALPSQFLSVELDFFAGHRIMLTVLPMIARG